MYNRYWTAELNIEIYSWTQYMIYKLLYLSILSFLTVNFFNNSIYNST